MKGLSHKGVKQVFNRGSGTQSAPCSKALEAYQLLRAAIESILAKIGCVPQTLNQWVKRAEIDSGVRDGVNTAEAQRVKELKREVK